MRLVVVPKCLCLALCLAVLVSSSFASQCLAQSDGNGVAAMPKGTVGAALIGAELGLVAPALFDMDGTWPYLVFPAVGAGAGVAVGLLALDTDGADPRVSVAVLVAGTALLIPSLVLTFAVTAYDPDDDDMSGLASYRAAPSAQEAARQAGTGFLRLSPDGAFVGAPAVAVTPPTPDRVGGVEVSVLSGRFF